MKRLVDDAELRVLLKHHLTILELEAKDIYPITEFSDDSWDMIVEQSKSMLNKYPRFSDEVRTLVSLVSDDV